MTNEIYLLSQSPVEATKPEDLIALIQHTLNQSIQDVSALMGMGFEVSIFLVNGDPKYSHNEGPSYRVVAKKELKG